MQERLWLLFPIALLAACQDPDVFKVGTILIDSITQTPEMIARDRVAAIPYATMGLQLGATPEVLLILGAQNASELDWYAGEDVFVRTRNGRVVRTVGLPYDLGGLRDVSAVTNNASSGASPASAQYLLDFPDLGVFGATAQCASKDMGDTRVQILGSELPARHVVEHCIIQTMRWNFNNEYWTDKVSGFVWRSRQYVHPELPPVNLEVFRPEQNRG